MVLRCAFAAALLVPALVGCGYHAEMPGPAGIPYSCAGGGPARIFYDGGDPNRSPARLEFGERSVLLRPAPAMTGLRYEGEGGLVWWSQGDEARLSEASAGGAEREIARCTRVREGEAAAAAAHGEDH